jgi:hypothetical protein
MLNAGKGQFLETSKSVGNPRKQNKKNTGYLLSTYLLTPWSRVLLEKLTGLQLVKKFPPFYGT